MTPSKCDRVFSAAEHLSLPCGDFKTLSRVIPRSAMFKSGYSKRAVQSSIKKKKFYSQFRKDTSVRKCFKKTVPILHSIAASYKLWILRWRCSVKAILGLCLSIYFYFTPPPPPNPPL